MPRQTWVAKKLLNSNPDGKQIGTSDLCTFQCFKVCTVCCPSDWFERHIYVVKLRSEFELVWGVPCEIFLERLGLKVSLHVIPITKRR
jgi:hypothetical protein